MSLLSALLSAASTKVGATVAGVTIAAGVAAATDNLPQALQVQVDDLLQSETADDRADEAKADAESRKASDEVGAEGHDGEGPGEEVSEAVHGIIDTKDSYDTGREFGQAVSGAARGVNGSAARTAEQQANAAEKRAAAHQRRADARANAGDVDAGDSETDARPEDAGAPDGVGGGRPEGVGNTGGATDE